MKIEKAEKMIQKELKIIKGFFIQSKHENEFI